MRDFPSCFGENGVQVADSSSSSSSSNTAKNAQNLSTCIYQCQIRGKSCLITVTWSKSLMGQGLTLGIDDSSNHCLCKVDIKPWLFSKRKGSKTLEPYSSCKIDVYWDLLSAKFGSGPEPLEGFYVCVVVDKQMLLLLGDMSKEAFKKTNVVPLRCSNSAFVSKRENLFGKKVFATKAQFSDRGKVHDLVIDCDTVSTGEPCLSVRVDGKNLLQVKRLRWKFRGNFTIVVDGIEVQVLWDVYNWLFGSSLGNAVFMFRTCLETEKPWSSSSTGSFADHLNTLSWSFSQRFLDSKSHQNLGFRLLFMMRLDELIAEHFDLNVNGQKLKKIMCGIQMPDVLTQEHMLFYADEKYLLEDSYSKYITEHLNIGTITLMLTLTTLKRHWTESIDKIQLLVEEKFQAVRNSDRSCSQFLGKPCASEHLQILVTISMIERLMHDIHFVVDPHNSSKKHVAYSNWFSTTSFPVLAWTDILVSFKAKFCSDHEKDVLKNRYKYLRRLYNEIKFLLEQNGFWWDT
ncbi:hypothetical protein ACFE04_027648 [Oxalis oulophora]